MKPVLTSLAQLPQMEPREFCRYYVARSIWEEEERGYRSKCIRTLAMVLHVPECTIGKNWGAGLDFEKCPDWAKRQLYCLHWIAQNAA